MAAVVAPAAPVLRRLPRSQGSSLTLQRPIVAQQKPPLGKAIVGGLGSLVLCQAVKVQRQVTRRRRVQRLAVDGGDDDDDNLKVVVRKNVIKTICRVGLWSAFTAAGAYFLYPSLQQFLLLPLRPPSPVTISGPSSEATDLLRHVTSWSGPRDSSPAPTSTSFEFVDPQPQPSTSVPVGETRDQIEAGFPPCPALWFGKARRLCGSALSGEERISRAWKAGQWAAAVAEGRVRSPNRSSTLDLRSRYYAVLRADGLREPTLFQSANSYFRADLEGGQELTLEALECLTDVVEPYLFVSGSLDDLDGRAEVGALVVLKRKEGLLLALPAGTLPEEVLEQGNAGGDSLTFGPSTVVRLPGIVLDGGSQQPAGEDVSVLIVDCSLSVLGYLREIRAFEEINYNFAEDSPYVLPASEALITAALEWVEAAEQDRVGYYSAESNVEDQSFVEPQPKGKVRPRKPVEKATLSGGGAKAGEKPKKATTASLAADLQLVLQSLPKLAEQVSEIGQRQKTFETQITDRLSSARPQLSQPLSRSLDFGVAAQVSSLAKDSKPPPRTVAEGGLGILTPQRHSGPVGLKELEMEKPDLVQNSGQSPDLAAAVLAQSQALTALVSQISSVSSDPMGDLAGSSLGTSTKGAVGRVSGVKYLERFGGYARQRELGMLQFQVMSIFDHLLVDNLGAARDGVALLAVTIEQMAMDNGRMDVAAVLSLQEDVPGMPTTFRSFIRSSPSPKENSKAKQSSSRTRQECSYELSGGGRGAMTSSTPRAGSFDKSEGQEPNPLTSSITFDRWLLCFPRWICKARSSFAWNLRRSFTAEWCKVSAPSTTFPLPVPHPGCFDGSGPGLSRARLGRLAKKRFLHCTVMALNFLFLGRFPTRDEIGRRPNAWQCGVFDRLRSLLSVCGSSLDLISLAPGRSGPQLGASLFQLEQFCQKLQLCEGGYGPKQSMPVFCFEEDPDLLPVSEFPQLEPYRSLQADRLRLTGTGKWPMADFISGPLWLPFQEPGFLLHDLEIDESAVPSFELESREENFRLLKVWDAAGLLHLEEEPLVEGHFSRVFNCFKAVDRDRQIGDRRLPNMRERRIDGPSRYLPTGYNLINVSAKRFKECLRGSLTDRRDYYHQAAITDERARTNMLPFRFSFEELEHTSALASWVNRRNAMKKPRGRRACGDGFGLVGCGNSARDVSSLYPCFKTLFQGDHLGVEFALEAHQGLLVSEDLLWGPYRSSGNAPFPLAHRYEGLIIDDYFCIGAEPLCAAPQDSFAYQNLAKARIAYEKHALAGSPEKDIEAECKFKAAGAECNSLPGSVRSGYVTIGAPAEKRLAIACLSLRLGRLRYCSSTLASRIAGNWTSVLMYRRCLSSIVDDLFAIGAAAEDESPDVVKPLSRKVVEELSLLAIFAPFMVTNAAADYSKKIFATDASLSAGAIVETDADEDLSRLLWRGGDKKGSYTVLDGGFRSALKALGEFYDDGRVEEPLKVSPKKSPLLYFDFIEFYGGAGGISKHLHDMGFSVAPPLDLSKSQAFGVGFGHASGVWDHSFSHGWFFPSVVLILFLGSADAMPLMPTTSADHVRAVGRAESVLIATRAVRKETVSGREKLLEDFRLWLLQEHHTELSTLLTQKPPDAEEVCRFLVLFGQEMFYAGRSYAKFSETINAISAARPILRRQLAGAWDLAFAWLADEPHQHHPALPLPILLASLTVSILWGWPRVAGVLGLTWAGQGVRRISFTFVRMLNLSVDVADGWTFLTGTKTIVPLGDVAQGYVGNVLALMSVLFSILAGNSYTSLYSQNEAIFCALFAEVSEAKALMEQIALVCSGRPFYRSALENIRRYVERDLRRLDRPPSILCACKPRDDPLESILYLTSVGVPSAVYETVRSLRQRRGDRLGAVQRKLPPVQMALLYVLGGFNLMSLLLLALANPSAAESQLCRMLFASMAGALMMTMRVIHELWTPVGGAYNVDGVLRVMIRGLEDELDQRLKGKTFSDTRLPPPPPSFPARPEPSAATA
eukprot:symbB.v1.2.008961.t1/scaffold508.1/size221222/10